MLTEVSKGIFASSDFHFFHKNIMVYEFEKRKTFFEQRYPHFFYKDGHFIGEHLTNLSEADRMQFFDTIGVEMVKQLEESLPEDMKDIKEFYCLGDFLFNARPGSITRFVGMKTYRELKKLMDSLHNAGTKTFFAYGNHDNQAVENKGFYESLFQNVDFFFISGDTLFTHYPLGSSQDEKHNPEGSFLTIDKELLKKKDIKVNVHGHTHSKKCKEYIPGITYINVSIEESL